MRNIDRHDIGDLGREREPGRVDVGDDDVARAHVPRHGGRHDADRPGAGDQHVFADEVEREGRMHGIAERIQDGAELVVDVVGQRHDVEARHLDVFGEGARNIDPDAAGLGIEMEAAATRGAALHADDVALARHALPDLETTHGGADLDDLARIFVPHHHGHRDGAAGPLVPAVDMDVGAADPGLVDPDQHVVGADHREGFVAEPQSGFGFRLDQGFHRGTSFG